MVELCHKCNSNELETFPTEVLLNEKGVTVVSLCDKCRRFWYSWKDYVTNVILQESNWY